MYFELILTLPVVPTIKIPEYAPEFHDVRSMLGDLCDALEGGASFSVSGFGQDVWPVDVRTDLTVFLEQLPEILGAIHCGRAAVLDFYEQGTERTIGFSPAGSDYLLSCICLTSWQPSVEQERIDRVRLLQMLVAVQDQFMAFVGAAAPELLNHAWIQAWLRPHSHSE